MASFKVWDGCKKVLSVDWAGNVIGIGGEGGIEIWRVGDSEDKV
jgi:ribosome biogenesis protein YTM1